MTFCSHTLVTWQTYFFLFELFLDDSTISLATHIFLKKIIDGRQVDQSIIALRCLIGLDIGLNLNPFAYFKMLRIKPISQKFVQLR